MISDVMKVLYFWILNILFTNVLSKVHLGEELFVDEHPLKAVGYVALCFAVVDSEGGVDADLIALFLVCSVRAQHENVPL